MKRHFLRLQEKLLAVAIAVLGLCAMCMLSFPGCLSEKRSESNVERMNALYRQSKLAFPEVPEVSAEKLMEKMKKETVVVVDNREDDERAVSMIPGAISAQEFEENSANYDDAAIVVYCTIGDRSGHYAGKLRKQNLDAYNLRGGVLAWAHAGGRFVDDRGNETRTVHVYGRKWNLLPEGYRAVW